MGMSLGLSFGLNGAGSAVAAAPATPTNLITNGDFTSTSPPPTLTASASSFMTVAGGTLNMVGGIGIATAWWDIAGFETGGSYYITGNMTARTTARAQFLVGGTVAATILATGVFSATVTAGSSDTRFTIKGTNASTSSATWSIDDVAVYRALQTLAWAGTGNVHEEAPVGTAVKTLDFTTTGSTLTLTNNAGGKFVLVGNEVRTAAALDYETATSHDIEVTETLAGAYGSPKATVLTVTVIDYAPTLSLAWGPSITLSTDPIGHEAGFGDVESTQQAGTTVSLLDSAGGKFAMSVDGSYNVSITTAVADIPAGDYDVTVRVTNPEATNSPWDVTHTITVQ